MESSVRSIPSRMKSVIWFLARPHLFPHLIHLVMDRLLLPPEPDTSEAATAWCRERGLTTEEAFKQITGSDLPSRIEELFPKELKKAAAIAESCPVWMGGPGDLDLLYHLVRHAGAKRVIETGVAYGWSSLAILLGMEGMADARLISSDMPYVQGANDPYVGCVVYEPAWRKKWTLIRRSDRQALPKAVGALGTIDICHYDSDKTARGRMWAYPILWKAIRSGGYFISDDINDNWGFRDFAAIVKATPTVIRVATEDNEKFVGVLIKP